MHIFFILLYYHYSFNYTALAHIINMLGFYHLSGKHFGDNSSSIK